MPDSARRPDASLGLPSGVLDNLLEGFQVISPEYRYIYVNDAVLRHGRTTSESLLGKTMMEVYPSIEETEMFAALRRCMRDRRPAQMENEFHFPDGAKGWFELRFEPVPEGVAILSIDVTDRKRAEIGLRRTMRALATLSRSNQTLVRAVDEDRFLEDVCRVVVETGGYPRAWIGFGSTADAGVVEPVVGAEAKESARVDVVAKKAWASGQSAPLVDRALTSGEPAVGHFAETERRRASSPDSAPSPDSARSSGFASCIALPILGDPEPMGVLTIYAIEREAFSEDERALLSEVALDLGYGIRSLRARSAQEQTAAELKKAQARSRAIYNHLPHAAFVWGTREGRLALLDLNEAAGKAKDTSSALLGSPMSALAEGIPHFEEDLSHCLDERGSIRREVDCILPGASESRRMALAYGFIPPDMVLMHAQDMTEQRRTEEQLLASQRLEAVGRLAGGVAHDFNNLLSVILTYTGFAIEELPPTNAVRGDIEQAHEAGQRAAALTKQLLAFSRRQILEPQVTNLNQIIAGLEKMLRRLVGEDVDIEIQAREDLGNVMADPSQLEQVVMNLVVNARDAMPRGGKLTIETTNVDLDEAYAGHHLSVEPGPYTLLSVADTGVGMSAETRSRVFEPFFTTKEKGKGTGLGLSTVYGIVKQSGGSVWVYSEPGRGTIFKIYLPRVDTPAVAQTPIEEDTQAVGSETILIVEDEEAVRGAAERILEGAGYRVIVAGNGGEALELCTEHEGRIDLLLTDVIMPEMSGRDLAEQLRPSCPELRVLFMSGYADAAVVHHGVLDPQASFVGKPFSATMLRRKVREVLDETAPQVSFNR